MSACWSALCGLTVIEITWNVILLVSPPTVQERLNLV